MDVLTQSLIPFVAILVFLVVVHEIGHFVTAKMAGVKVLEFGIGYPPRAWGKKYGETEYTINWLPLGGFVRLLGEEDPSDPRSLAAKPRWVRIVVLLAGAAMNVLLAVLLFTVTFLIPQDVPVGRAVVDKVNPGSPAEKAGVKTGDIILRINGREVENFLDASYYIRLNQGETMTWTLRRPLFGGSTGAIGAGTETITTRVYARWAPPIIKGPDGEKVQQGPTGITLAPRSGQVETRSYPVWEAVPRGVRATAESLVLARNQIISWWKARTAPEVSGPVGIAQATGEVVDQAGWLKLFEFAALLSINLAIINVLPLPMLDGGRVLFILVELLRGGRRVPPEKEALVHLAGFVVLLSLVVVISYFDILRIVNGESLFK
jgi:regulator of sigma E protease